MGLKTWMSIDFIRQLKLTAMLHSLRTPDYLTDSIKQTESGVYRLFLMNKSAILNCS
jgi:hypothetical protein